MKDYYDGKAIGCGLGAAQLLHCPLLEAAANGEAHSLAHNKVEAAKHGAEEAEAATEAAAV
jgi:hypothetical protein